METLIFLESHTDPWQSGVVKGLAVKVIYSSTLSYNDTKQSESKLTKNNTCNLCQDSRHQNVERMTINGVVSDKTGRQFTTIRSLTFRD